jgi:hypothetical protein
MNPINSGSVPATTGRVHATIGRVRGMIGRVHGTIHRVPGIVGRVRKKISVEYHTSFTPYSVEPDTSDMFHR